MEAKLYITKKDGMLKETRVRASADDGVEDEALNIYGDVKGQCFEGFGGALTDAAEKRKKEYMRLCQCLIDLTMCYFR